MNKPNVGTIGHIDWGRPFFRRTLIAVAVKNYIGSLYNA